MARSVRLIVAISRARPDVAPGIEERVRAAFSVLEGRPPAIHRSSGETVCTSAPEAGDVVDGEGPRFAALLLRSSYTRDGVVLDGTALLDRIGRDRDGALRSLVPPFAACFREHEHAPVVLATDTCGLRHCYWWQGDGWAAMSSSSVALSWVVGASIDTEAMGMFALVGNHLQERTPFAGVRKLDAGHVALLRDGVVTTEVFEPQVASEPVASGGRAAQAARGVTVLRDAVAAAIDAYPDAGLELSGGFDSRAVLAAIPKAKRRGRLALTLGTPGNPDIRIASDLAEREGLRHTIVDLTGLERLVPEEVLALTARAARRRDCTANPVGTGVLDWVEQQVEQVPRLNGQNSEFGRAHLYPGQGQQGAITDERVDRLARWRIMQNHSTDPVVVQDAFHEAGRQASFVALREQFRRFDVDWLRSLDEYYFLSRMQRWAGIDYTAAGYERVVLSPFFHPDYLTWVRRTDPADRRASHVFAGMFDLLDPELATIPLHLGISPHEVAVGGPLVAAKRAGIGGAQTAAKIWQRVRKVGRGSSGADRFGELVVDAWRTVDDPTPRLERYDFVDLDGVQQVLRGEVSVSSATVAFLADLEELSRLEDELDAALVAGARAGQVS